MKFSLLFFATFIVVAHSAPQTDIEESLSDHEEAVLVLVDNFFQNVQESLRSNPIVSVIAKSFDTNCMIKEFKKHHSIDYIYNGAGARDSAVLISTTAALCSSKLDVHVDYIFDTLMIHHALLTTYFEDPEFKEYSEWLTCANNYAVEHKILDPTVYNFTYKLEGLQEEICMELVEQVNMFEAVGKMEARRFFERNCAMKFVPQLRNFILKYVLLIQVDLTVDQRQQERINFNKDFKTILTNMLECAQKPITRRYDPFEAFSRFRL